MGSGDQWAPGPAGWLMQESVVLLPAYCEVEAIPCLLPRLSDIDGLDVLVIDDASPDGTGACAEALRGEHPVLSVLHRKKKEGLGRAYVHGMKEALARGYTRIVTMDADLSHAPEDVPRLLGALEAADVVVGSRHAPGGGVESWPMGRRVLSCAGSLYARALLGLPVRDATSGFRAYRAEVLEAIDLDRIRARGFVFQVEVLRRILDLEGARVREVPIRFRNRTRGRSKLTLGIISEAATEVLRLRFREVHRGSSRPQEESRPALSVSVIIPLRPGAPEPRALEALESTTVPRGGLEVILARGEWPSRQRNAAAREASGDLLLFLDDDSDPAPDVLERYIEVFGREPDLAAAGGPAVYRAAGFRERVVAAVLSEPLVTGRSASRYSARGAPRRSDERDLILANLAVRRSAFERAGGFEETLYPNEENLFLERLRERGEGILYQPGVVVTRPSPGAGFELLAKVLSYGRGRAAQARRRFSRPSEARVSGALATLLSLAAAFAALPLTPLGLLALGSVLVSYHALLAARIARREGIRTGITAPLVASAIHLAYAVGILSGLLCRLPTREGPVSVEKKTLRGRVSPGSTVSSTHRRSPHVQEEGHRF